MFQKQPGRGIALGNLYAIFILTEFAARSESASTRKLFGASGSNVRARRSGTSQTPVPEAVGIVVLQRLDWPVLAAGSACDSRI